MKYKGLLMPANSPTSPRRLKRSFWVGITILMIIVLYTAGWFYMASMAKQRMRNELSANSQSLTSRLAGQFQCGALSARGFPFSLSVSCDQANYQDKNQIFALAAQSIDLGASLFAPNKLQSRIVSPAHFAISDGAPLQASWDKLTSSARLNGKKVENIAIQGQNLRLMPAENGATAEALSGLTMQDFQLDLNAVEQPMQLKISFDDLHLTGASPLSALPELDGVLDISSPLSLAGFAQRDDHDTLWRGKSLQLNQLLFLLPSGASISISGPASVDEDGLANADLKIRLTNAPAIGSALQQVFPEQAKTIQTIVFALGSMPKDETGATLLPVEVRNGKVSAGFIPLGRLPAL